MHIFFINSNLLSTPPGAISKCTKGREISSANDIPLNPVKGGTGYEINRSLDRGVGQSAMVSSVLVL
jgi:hypothetical protein